MTGLVRGALIRLSMQASTAGIEDSEELAAFRTST